MNKNRKIIASINITLDGYCDHTSVDPDEEVHDHYTDLLKNAGLVLYGRHTFELMKYWKDIIDSPSDIPSMNEFAKVMDEVPKLVFSNTLQSTDWDSVKLSTKGLHETVLELKQTEGGDVYVGSPGLINTLTQSGLIDEYQICVHPVIAGSGKQLFTELSSSVPLKLKKVKTFKSGAVVLYYHLNSQPR